MYRIVKVVEGPSLAYKIQKFYGIWRLGFWVYITYNTTLFGYGGLEDREFNSCEEAERWLREYLTLKPNYCIVVKIIK